MLLTSTNQNQQMPTVSPKTHNFSTLNFLQKTWRFWIRLTRVDGLVLTPILLDSKASTLFHLS